MFEPSDKEKITEIITQALAVLWAEAARQERERIIRVLDQGFSGVYEVVNTGKCNVPLEALVCGKKLRDLLEPKFM